MNNNHRLSLTALIDIPCISPGDDIQNIIEVGLDKTGIQLESGDVIVVTHKIVSKLENRYVDLRNIIPTKLALDLSEEVGKDPRLVQLILSESVGVVAKKKGVLITEHRLGFVLANAGIDASNIHQNKNNDHVLLLPIDPDGTCKIVRQGLELMHDVEIAVVINDSHGRAWRNGTVGVALGASGLPALLDLRGSQDIFGRELKVTEVGWADELASAASLLMGQGSEMRPIIHIRGLSWADSNGKAFDLIRKKDDDLFR
tara:strand:- start:2474 stop:3247 length:774 start_codon:yes stop_codon:yes gene_type:complete